MFSRNSLRSTFSAIADGVFSGWKSYPLPTRQKTCGGADLPLKIWTAVIVFVGSYLPLSVILLIQDFDAQDKAAVWLAEIPKLKHPMLSVGILLIASSCLILSIVFLGIVQPKRSIEIKSTKYVPTDMINYSFPYIVSFMSLSFDDPQKLLGLCVFMIILFLITYRSGRIFVNPLLIVFGWRLFEIEYCFAGDTEILDGLALARRRNLSVGFLKCAQIEDILVSKADDDART